MMEESNVHIADNPFSQIGGHKQVLEDLCYNIQLPQLFPDKVKMQKSGILFCGPPGCGKTLIARQLSQLMGDCFFLAISGPELMNKFVGEAEQKLRDIFETAIVESQMRQLPSFIFFDEIDSVLGKRDTSDNNFEIRFVDQFLTLMDGFKERGNVIVIGATNRIHAIDKAARRPGRFDEEVHIGNPSQEDLEEIFTIFMKQYTEFVSISKSISQEFVHQQSFKLDGYNGSDIEGLFKKAYENCKKRCFTRINGRFQQIQELSLEDVDLIKAVQDYTPIYKRDSDNVN